MSTGYHADTTEFKRLFARSSQVEPKLRAALRKNIRGAANEAARAVKSELQQPGGTQSSHPKHTGLRARIAAGVQVKVMTGARAGVTIVASSRAMKADEATLVRAWEASGGWRHPVFGDRGAWATQKGRPYFRHTITARQNAVRAAVEAAMREAAESLKGR
jgi:hypothetical protein